MRPRPAYLTTLRASSEVTVTSRVWSIKRKPSAAATERTSLRAMVMSCSLSRAIDLLCKRNGPPVIERLRGVVVHRELAPQKPDALVHVQHRVNAAQFESEFDERDGDGGLHPDDDRSRVHDARHRRDVREHATDEGVNHLKQRDVYQHAARARPLKLGQYPLLKVHDRLVVHVHLNRHDQHAPDLQDWDSLLSVHLFRVMSDE